jgi:hypothetical protein
MHSYLPPCSRQPAKQQHEAIMSVIISWEKKLPSSGSLLSVDTLNLCVPAELVAEGHP